MCFDKRSRFIKLLLKKFLYLSRSFKKSVSSYFFLFIRPNKFLWLMKPYKIFRTPLVIKFFTFWAISSYLVHAGHSKGS